MLLMCLWCAEYECLRHFAKFGEKLAPGSLEQLCCACFTLSLVRPINVPATFRHPRKNMPLDVCACTCQVEMLDNCFFKFGKCITPFCGVIGISADWITPQTKQSLLRIFKQCWQTLFQLKQNVTLFPLTQLWLQWVLFNDASIGRNLANPDLFILASCGGARTEIPGPVVEKYSLQALLTCMWRTCMR